MEQPDEAVDLDSFTPSLTPNDDIGDLKNPDTTWLSLYKDKQWPVVLCTYEQTPNAFQAVHPPRDTHLPAILLGKHIFVSADKGTLSAYEPTHDYLAGCPPHDGDLDDSEEGKLERKRRLAFRDEVPQHRSAQQWCEYIKSDREARRLAKARDLKHGSSVSRSSAGSDVQITGSRKRQRTSEPGPYAHAVNGRRLSRQSSNFYRRPPTPEQTPTKQSKRKPASRITSRDQKKGDAQVISPAPEGKCTIIVGEDETPFVVDLDSLNVSQELENLVTSTDERGHHLTLSGSYDISAKTFMPVFEYLNSEDFRPVLARSAGVESLVGITTESEKTRAEVRIAYTYRVASLLHIEPLQALCLQKIEMLYPLSTGGIVALAQAWFKSEKWGFDRESAMEQLAKDYLVEQFWAVMAQEGKALSVILQESSELRKDVLGEMLNAE